jgi:hypothetical protein
LPPQPASAPPAPAALLTVSNSAATRSAFTRIFV